MKNSAKTVPSSSPFGAMYRPEFERDNCGFGLIAHMDGVASHKLLKTAIESLNRLWPVDETAY